MVLPEAQRQLHLCHVSPLLRQLLRQLCHVCSIINLLTTRYVLGGLGIDFPWVGDFPQKSTQARMPTQPPVQSVSGFFPEVKWPGRGVDHPQPLAP